MLKEHRDKVGEADIKAVEAALEDTKKAMHEGGAERISQATSKLETASHKLAEAMYKASSQTAGQPGGGAQTDGKTDGQKASDSKPKDNVVDAEFVDVEDKK
jgi:molecular chaperone DnaK